MKKVCTIHTGMEIYCNGCTHQGGCLMSYRARLTTEIGALKQKLHEAINRAKAIKGGAL